MTVANGYKFGSCTSQPAGSVSGSDAGQGGSSAVRLNVTAGAPAYTAVSVTCTYTKNKSPDITVGPFTVWITP